MKIKLTKIAIITTLIALGIIVRAYVAFVIKPINGDSAVFALMAKHMFELKEFFIYVPLNHYAGALSSYIGAGLFAIFGISFNSYIAAGLLFSSSGLILGCILSHKILNGFGAIVSDTLIAIPSFLIIYYSLFTGPHAENFLFIPALLLLAIKINRDEYAYPALFMVIAGCVSGLVIWTTPGAVPAVLTIVTLLFVRKREHFSASQAVLFFAGIALGYAPAIFYNFQYPGATLFRLAGRVLDLDRAALSDPHLLNLVFGKMLWRLSTIPRSLARIPHLTAELISLPAMILLFISIAISLAGSMRKFFNDKRINEIGVILIYVFWFVLFYVFLVGEEANRYIVPLCIVAPFLIGNTISRIVKGRKTAIIIIIIPLLIINVFTIVSQRSVFWADRYTKLTDWLLTNNAVRGYSDYDTAYSAQFISGERVLLSPTLFHPTFSDRWPEDTKKVRSAADVCYIIDGKTYPEVVIKFEDNLTRLRQSYKKEQIGDFTVYRGISPDLHPEDIVIGMSRERTR